VTRGRVASWPGAVAASVDPLGDPLPRRPGASDPHGSGTDSVAREVRCRHLSGADERAVLGRSWTRTWPSEQVSGGRCAQPPPNGPSSGVTTSVGPNRPSPCRTCALRSRGASWPLQAPLTAAMPLGFEPPRMVPFSPRHEPSGCRDDPPPGQPLARSEHPSDGPGRARVAGLPSYLGVGEDVAGSGPGHDVVHTAGEGAHRGIMDAAVPSPRHGAGSPMWVRLPACRQVDRCRRGPARSVSDTGSSGGRRRRATR
jgi:hypothetical protein